MNRVETALEVEKPGCGLVNKTSSLANIEVKAVISHLQHPICVMHNMCHTRILRVTQAFARYLSHVHSHVPTNLTQALTASTNPSLSLD